MCCDYHNQAGLSAWLGHPVSCAWVCAWSCLALIMGLYNYALQYKTCVHTKDKVAGSGPTRLALKSVVTQMNNIFFIIWYHPVYLFWNPLHP
jgi:antibiotic biosynthesis monooxygenase (ABM) superfamily enzyme